MDEIENVAQMLLDSADDTGCTDDLIVVSKSTLATLLDAIGVHHDLD